MKFYTLHAEQFVPEPIDKVFEFFSRPENLAVITPKSVGFIILTPSPIEMKCGVLISYTIRLLFARVRWTSIISSYEPPHRFVDEQLRGPYAFWHHTHTFRKTDEGTLITDDVRYSIPFSVFGIIVHRTFVRRQLSKIFSFRALRIKGIFGGDKKQSTESEKIIFGEAQL